MDKNTFKKPKRYAISGTPFRNVPLKLACARDYETFFMLNRAEHEILNARMYKNSKKFSFFQAKKNLEKAIFSTNNCKNANNCWHFNIYGLEKFHAQLS